VGRCSFLGLLHSEEAGKLYRVIRMQINEPEERNLDDEDTDGEVVEESQMYEENDGIDEENWKKPEDEDLSGDNEEAKLSEEIDSMQAVSKHPCEFLDYLPRLVVPACALGFREASVVDAVSGIYRHLASQVLIGFYPL
jgi:hypothetical protein